VFYSIEQKRAVLSNDGVNRRQFIVTTGMTAAATMIPSRIISAAEQSSKGVSWPIGSFNRPWFEKKDYGLDVALDGIRDAGYKIVGLLRSSQKDPLTGPAATPEYLQELKKRIESRGLTVNMTALRPKNDAPLDDQVKHLQQQVDHAKALGAEFGLTFGVDDPKYYENYYKLMHETADYARSKAFKIVLKPHGGASGAAEEIERCIKKVNHPNFKIWFDAGNIIYYTGKDPVEQLKPIAQYVTGFCAKDCDHQKGSVLLEFGTGKVDFRAVFSVLKKAGFNGPVMVECVAPATTPEQATENARKNREYLANLFASL
jgi:sugar phosphate isomerase/epimerase